MQYAPPYCAVFPCDSPPHSRPSLMLVYDGDQFMLVYTYYYISPGILFQDRSFVNCNTLLRFCYTAQISGERGSTEGRGNRNSANALTISLSLSSERSDTAQVIQICYNEIGRSLDWLSSIPTKKHCSRLECVSKCREMQFRVDLPAFQGDFPQVYWR